MLANGILFVNRWPATKDRADMVFQTTLASVTVKNALATIVAERGRTLVEVGENEVFVLGASEAGGEPVRVPAGHYAVVVRNGTVQVKKGLLAWRLEP